MTDESTRRIHKRVKGALIRANFINQKFLEEFGLIPNPNINRSLIVDQASCRFIEEKVYMFIFSPCGADKSPITQTLRHCAIRKGADERKCTIVNSNLNILEWVNAILSSILGATTIDQLRHNVNKIVLNRSTCRIFRSELKTKLNKTLNPNII